MIITGAGAGLGRAYAQMYGRLGANVVVNDVSEKGANVVVEEVTKGQSAALKTPIFGDLISAQPEGKLLPLSARLRTVMQS